MIDSMYTVGELADKMKVSVRTLQYYDRQGLLKPSAYSEGGRRLYGPKDAVRLQHILSLKFIGLSLDEIKQQLSAESDAAHARQLLDRQIAITEMQIARLKEALVTLKFVAEEIGGESEIDFERVADAIFAVRTVEERDWPALDEFGSELKSHIEARAERDEQFMLRLAQRFEAVSNRMYELSQAGADPAGPEGRAAAQALWAMIEDFTEGDMGLLPQLMEFGQSKENWPDEMRGRQEAIDDFMGRSLFSYLEEQAAELDFGQAGEDEERQADRKGAQPTSGSRKENA